MSVIENMIKNAVDALEDKKGRTVMVLRKGAWQRGKSSKQQSN